VIAGDHEEPPEIKPGISCRRPQNIPGRELAAIADVPGNEYQVRILDRPVAKKAKEIGVHVASAVFFPAPIVGGRQVEVGEVGNGDRGRGVC
jgi:hypothetical protein